MSMTRKEIIKELEKTVAGAEILTSLGYEEVNEYLDIFRVALSALRPVTREQVEKVWRGCDLCLDDSWQRNLMVPKRFDHTSMLSAELAQFCPGCGRPLTDEALEITMKRLEELRND